MVEIRFNKQILIILQILADKEALTNVVNSSHDAQIMQIESRVSLFSDTVQLHTSF